MALPAEYVVEVPESAPLLDPSKRGGAPPPEGEARVSADYQATHHGNLRRAFLRRVYGLLGGQVALNAAVVALCMYQPTARALCLDHPALIVWGSLLPTLLCLFALFSFKDRYPANALLLGGFTLGESLALATVCALYQSSGFGAVVLQAFGVTLALFAALTAVVSFSKVDFSFLGAGLGVGLLALLTWGVLQLLFGWHQIWLYSLLGALLFSGFVLFDTWMIMERYGYDDYIPAAAELYLDFINLFLNILRLFGGHDR